VALDNFLCLIFRTRRIAARVRDNQIDPSPRQREILIFEKRADALLEMNAAGGKRAGFYSEQADLEWRILCDRRHRKCGGSSRGTGEKLAAIGPVGHGILPGELRLFWRSRIFGRDAGARKFNHNTPVKLTPRPLSAHRCLQSPAAASANAPNTEKTRGLRSRL